MIFLWLAFVTLRTVLLFLCFQNTGFPVIWFDIQLLYYNANCLLNLLNSLSIVS